jgi:hypothetical protein
VNDTPVFYPVHGLKLKTKNLEGLKFERNIFEKIKNKIRYILRIKKHI